MRPPIQRLLFAAGIFLLPLAFVTKAVIVEILDLDKITNDATLIVAAEVTSVQEIANTTVRVGDREVSAKAMTADLRIASVLKGDIHGASSVTLRFVLPDEFVGWRSITPLSYRVFFLTGGPPEFKLVSPYNPSVVALPGVEVTQGTPIEHVIAQLSAVLESATGPFEAKSEAVFTLRRTRSAIATRALGRAVDQVKDRRLGLSISAALLERNDISTLPNIETVLLKPDPTVPADVLHNLSYAILIGVKDERAVPALTRLLRAGNAEVRRAAASALMHIGDTSAIDPLASALDDSDHTVQYYAVVGLAEITGQADWRPNTYDFTADPNKYLNHWREWAQKR